MVSMFGIVTITDMWHHLSTTNCIIFYNCIVLYKLCNSNCVTQDGK